MFLRKNQGDLWVNFLSGKIGSIYKSNFSSGMVSKSLFDPWYWKYIMDVEYNIPICNIYWA